MNNEEIKFGEQLASNDAYAVETGLENEVGHEEGSPLGKFKNSDKLLEAYNELQSEFTRKCQKLSETERKLQESVSMDNSGKVQDAGKENEFSWNKNIKEFLQSHKNASDLSKEITEELIEDSDLRSSQDGLEKAYLRVLDKKYIPHDKLVKDDDFLNKYVYNNEEIKEKIIKDYVSSLNQTQSPIVVASTGYDRGVATKSNFNSLDEARKFVEDMFKF